MCYKNICEACVLCMLYIIYMYTLHSNVNRQRIVHIIKTVNSLYSPSKCITFCIPNKKKRIQIFLLQCFIINFQYILFTLYNFKILLYSTPIINNFIKLSK